MHAVIGSGGGHADETVDPGRSLLSEKHQGTFAERVAVPARNLIPKPAVADLGAGRVPADRLADRLSDALHPLRARARADGAHPGRRRRRVDGADHAGPPGGLPGLGDLAATRPSGRARSSWERTRRSHPGRGCPSGWTWCWRRWARPPGRTRCARCRPGGRVVIAGATSGSRAAGRPVADLLPPAVGRRLDDGDPRRARATGRDVRRYGPAAAHRPELPLTSADEALRRVAAGDLFGKVVLTR